MYTRVSAGIGRVRVYADRRPSDKGPPRRREMVRHIKVSDEVNQFGCLILTAISTMYNMLL